MSRIIFFDIEVTVDQEKISVGTILLNTTSNTLSDTTSLSWQSLPLAHYRCRPFLYFFQINMQ
jgi:hypothetical protein